MTDQVLYRAGPDEVIEYSQFQEVTHSNIVGPYPSETHHDVVVAILGGGVARWDDQERPLTLGQPVVLPHGVRYELECVGESPLHVMIFGISLKFPDQQENA